MITIRNRQQWRHVKKAVLYIGGFAIFFMMIRLRQYQVYEKTVLHSATAEEVWEFLADFSKLKTLNPTIVDFEILDESGIPEDWHYAVRYTERLHSISSIKNTIVADIHARKTNLKRFIDSNHTTCFFNSLYCLKARGQFRITELKKPMLGSEVEEYVVFECPSAFSWFCHREALFQRKAIKTNLVHYFDKIKTHVKN